MKRSAQFVLSAITCLALAACGPGPASSPVVNDEPAEKGNLSLSTEAYVDEGYIDYPEFEYVDWNTEEYDSIDENGFISTATRPLSTVSSDVDTASYANLRRMLKDGYRASEIPSGSVRIEEMLNYFDYDYPNPSGDDLFSITAQLGDCPWNADTKLLTLGFATSPEATSVADAGQNLVFLIDISGSMDEADKIDLLKEAFSVLIKQLDKNDTVSIVTYASGEDIVAEAIPGDQGREILRAVNSLRASGSTNGEAGLQQAYEVAERHFIKGGVNRIIMASDGDLNVGMSSESDLHDYVDEKRKTGIYLSVLGFGAGNYKDNKMETLADHGNGSYHYIDCIEEAERVFEEKLCANLVPLADDVKVQVEFNPAQIKGYRLIGYENRAMADEDFKNDEKDAGDVGPGSQFTVAYEVVPVGSAFEVPTPDLKYGTETAQSTSDEWLTAKVRYRPADGSDVREQDLVVKGDEKSNDDWTFQAGVIEFGMLLRDSAYKGTSTWESAYKLVDSSKGSDSLREELLELIELAGTGNTEPTTPVKDAEE